MIDLRFSFSSPPFQYITGDARCVALLAFRQETITCEYAENGQLISVAQTGPLDVGLRWRSSKSVEAWDSIQVLFSSAVVRYLMLFVIIYRVGM